MTTIHLSNVTRLSLTLIASIAPFTPVLHAKGSLDTLTVEDMVQQPDYQQILNLTQEQALQFTALLTVYQPRIQELMTELQQAGSIFKKRSISRSLKPLSEELDLQIQSILDDQQYDQWKAIQAERRAEMRKKLR